MRSGVFFFALPSRFDSVMNTRMSIATAPFPALTGLRGLAALAVFCLHAWSLCGRVEPLPEWPAMSAALRWLFGIGWVGVDVFFTLSGFLLALPFLRDPSAAPVVRNFLARRWLRIFPAYYAQLLVLWLIVPQLPALATALRNVPEGMGVLAHGLLWFFAWPAVTPWLTVWWSLPVEFGFYLLLPLLARWLSPGRWPWLLALPLLGLVWRWTWLNFAEPGLLTVYRVDQLPGRIGQFVIGMLAAMLWVRRADWRERVSRHAQVLFVCAMFAVLLLPAAWLLVNPTAHDLPSVHPLLLGWHDLASLAVAGLILASCTAGGGLVGLLRSPPLMVLGTVSYGLYLWHFPVLLCFRVWLREPGVAWPGFWMFWSLSLLASLALASLSYWLVERPCLRRA